MARWLMFIVRYVNISLYFFLYNTKYWFSFYMIEFLLFSFARIVFDKLMAFGYFLSRILFDLISVKLSFFKDTIFIRHFIILHVISGGISSHFNP